MIVLLETKTVATAKPSTPPAFWPAEFPLIVLPVTVAIISLPVVLIPPPSSSAELSLMMLSVIVTLMLPVTI